MRTKPQRKVLIAITLDKASGRELLSGILHYVNEGHDWALELDLHPETVTAASAEKVLGNGIEGIILTLPSQPDVHRVLARTRIPIVCVNVQDEALAMREGPTRFVWTDNAAIGNLAAEHIRTRGNFSSYAFIGEKDAPWSDARFRGFKAALGRTSSPVQTFNFTRIPATRKETSCFQDWLAKVPLPCAIFAAYDGLAREVLNAARTLQIKVPERLIVIGADDYDTIVNQESLTSIRLAHHDMGYQAARALNRLLDHHPASSEPVNIPPQAVVERMTTRYRFDKRLLMREINSYISDHATEPHLCAEAIARHFACSRSKIEHLFKEMTGTSLYQAILNRRIETARRRRKRDPQMTLAEAARASGFADAVHLSHAMRKQKKKSAEDCSKAPLRGYE